VKRNVLFIVGLLTAGGPGGWSAFAAGDLERVARGGYRVLHYKTMTVTMSPCQREGGVS